MKKTLVASALGAFSAFSGIAHAQSSVTVYGILDAGFVREQGGSAGSVSRISSGPVSASRIGFRGAEALGDGWSAIFTLEAGSRIDTGEIDAPGTLFNRQAYVGLSGPYGALTLGRQYTPYYKALSQVGDPFGAGYAGSAKNLFPTVGPNTRTSNTVLYVSPNVGGVAAELAFSLGEQAGSSTAGRQIGAALSYSAGRLNARLAHNHRNNDITAAAGAAQVPPVAAAERGTGRNTLLAANYDFGPATGYLAYSIDKGLNSALLPNNSNPYGGTRPTASTDSRDLLVGVSLPLGANTLLASYSRKDDRTALSQDADQWALGLNHALSKRTSLYASYGKIKNRRGAGYTVGNNTDIGSGERAYNLGLRHAF